MSAGNVVPRRIKSREEQQSAAGTQVHQQVGRRQQRGTSRQVPPMRLEVASDDEIEVPRRGILGSRSGGVPGSVPKVKQLVPGDGIQERGVIPPNKRHRVGVQDLFGKRIGRANFEDPQSRIVLPGDENGFQQPPRQRRRALLQSAHDILPKHGSSPQTARGNSVGGQTGEGRRGELK